MHKMRMTYIAALKTALVSAIVNIAPYLALVPTCWLIGTRTMQHLGWPWPVALAAALAVEFLGLAVTVTALGAYTWNRSKREKDPSAPLALPLALVAVYFVSAELLTVGLDVAPSWPGTVAQWSQAIFPVLGLAGMAVLAIRYDQDVRAAGVTAQKAEAKAERAARLAAERAECMRAQAQAAQVMPEMPVAIPEVAITRLKRAEALATFPGLFSMPRAEAAELAGVSERTIRNWRNDGHRREERSPAGGGVSNAKD